MKWETDQREGFFGWDDGQPLHVARVELHDALESSRELMEMYLASQSQPELPAFTGGTLDSWPAAALDGFGVLRIEVERIRRHIQSEAKP